MSQKEELCPLCNVKYAEVIEHMTSSHGIQNGLIARWMVNVNDKVFGEKKELTK